MNYINTETLDYPLSEQAIRTAHLDYSPPTPFQPPAGYAPVFDAPQPAHDAITQVVREVAPVLTDKGHWQQQWEVVPRFETGAEADAAVAADLASKRANIWERIKELRDEKIQRGGYKAAGKWFHSDTFSRSQQLGLARKADRIEMSGGDMDAQFTGPGPGGLLFWKTMDGSFVPMTVRLAQQVFDAAEASDGVIFSHAESLHLDVETAPDPTAIDIAVGWPETFAGV